MVCRYDVLREFWALALVAAAGCSGHGAARPDAAVPDPPDAAPDAAIDAAPDGPSGTAITIKTFPGGLPTYDNRMANAALVAFQDGDGAWVALTGTGGVYHARATGQRYGVAVGCATEATSGVHLYYQSVSDTTEVLADGCFEFPETVTLSIDLQGLMTGQTAEAWLGDNLGISVNGSPLAVTHPRGAADLFLRTYVVAAGRRTVLAFVRGPTIDLAADQTTPIDLDAQGRPPESHPLTVTGLNPPGAVMETSSVHSSYATPHSELQWPLDTTPFAAAPPDTYVTIDAALRQPGDISNLTVNAQGTTSDGRSYERYVRLAMTTPVAVTTALPAIWSATAPTLDRAGPPRATVTLPITPGALGTSDYHALLSTPTGGAFARTLAVTVRPGWAAGAASVTITTPDLSSLPGWIAGMAIATDTAVDWSLEWDDRNLTYEALPSDGRKIFGTIISGQIAAP